MNEPKPLPCPFCGGMPTLTGNGVGCFEKGCPCNPFVEGLGEAIKAWNTRHLSSHPSPWGRTLDADDETKVDEQLEKDIELVRKAAAKEPQEVYTGRCGPGPRVFQDTPILGSQSAAIARTILHILKR